MANVNCISATRLDRKDVAFAVAVALAALAIFLPSTGYDFVEYDDKAYVYGNAQVMQGLTWPGAIWALTTNEQGNWHPLTWFSHMLDVTLFGSWAGGHHLTSVLLHTANTFLVSIVLRLMTNAPGRSAAVALLFAVHPLRAESVAWVAERKDVLSTFFVLIALVCYVQYVRRGSARWYVAIILCHAMSLLAKSMYVTLPALLLLLDYWPLDRGRSPNPQSPASKRSLAQLLAEKAPLILLSLGFSIITLLAQRSNMIREYQVSLGHRLANTAIAYVRYIAGAFWPANLACFYPHPLRWPAWAVVVAIGLLVLISAVIVARGRRWPVGVTGWFWFMGTMVPVIGIVQVGRQSMADRYTYFPSIGITLIAVWAFADLARRWRLPRACGGGVLVAVAAALAIRTALVQLPTWRDGRALFEHALAVTGPNAVANFGLANQFASLQRPDLAVPHYEVAVQFEPTNHEIHNNLAVQLLHLGRVADAVAHLQVAARLSPESASVARNLANALALRPETRRDSIPWFERCSRLAPGDADLTLAWARALEAIDELDAATARFRQAAAERPNWAEPYNLLGVAYAQRGMAPQAIDAFRLAVQAEPANPGLRANLRRAMGALTQPATRPH